MNNVKYYRGMIGMTQQELADKLGIVRTNVSMIENGQIGNVSFDTVEKLCELFGVTPIRLFGLEALKYAPQNDNDIDYLIGLLMEEKNGKE